MPAPAYAHASGGEAPKSFIVTWILALLLGSFGVDRFYLGKIGTAIVKLLTLGGWGVWSLVDLIITLTGNQRDKHGRPLEGYARNKKVAWIVTGALIVLPLVISMVVGLAGIAGGAAIANRPASGPAVSSSEAAVPEVAAEEPAPEPVAVNAAAAWADKTFGTFEPIVESGTGDNIVSLPAGATAAIVTSSHDGERNFAIVVLDAANTSTGDLLVNTIGAYSGTSAYGFNSFSEGTSLKITADGNWTVTISPVSTAPELAASGAGDAVYLYNGSASKLTATHTGERNFIVMEETSEAFSFGLLVNDIGPYSGTVPLSAGPSVISVGADGAWTLAVG